MSTDIAAIVNLHCEGAAASASITSAWRAVSKATDSGRSAELVLVLDRTDDATSELATRWEARGAHLVVCNEGDLGGARNAAVDAVDAEWVAFLDADDLWREDWLMRALEAANDLQPSPGPDVLHPAVNVIFGDHHSLLHHVASTDPAFSWARFRLHNVWTALSFVRRQTVIDLPYPRNALNDGFGYEDWSWNMAVLDTGGRHHVVADTCHFIRRTNAPSLLSESRAALRSPYPLDVQAPRPLAQHMSYATPTSSGLPATHQLLPHRLSDAMLTQVRLASTIEPAVAETLTGAGHPRTLPQNLNTHVTAMQRALESVELRLEHGSVHSLADALADDDYVAALSQDEQHQVVAELLRSPSSERLPHGKSPVIDAAYRAFPQLTSVAPAQQ